MSVINKMLRDLDQRTLASAVAAEPRSMRQVITRDTHTLPIPILPKGSTQFWRAGIKGVLSLIAVVGVGAGLWWAQSLRVVPERPVVQMSVAAQPAQPVLPAAVTVPVIVDPIPLAAPVQVAALRPVQSMKREVAEQKMETPVLAKPETPVIPPNSSPEREILVQAQSMWRGGARIAAMDLLTDAIAAIETQKLTEAPLSQKTRLADLVRELARMQLLEGQVSPTWEMLVRLEPVLSGFADVWAIRGNVAQRLGRHQASVDAYLTALKSQPNEPRWMLGAAVSLAALGQMTAAGELVEKASASGAITRELAAYLRQAGVPMPER